MGGFTIGSFFLRLGVDQQQYLAGIQRAKQATQTLQQQMLTFSRHTRVLGEDLTFLGSRFTFAFTGPVALATKTMIEWGGIMDRTRISLTALTGSAEVAGNLLGQLRKRAMETPFEFEGLTEETKRLVAMNFAVGELMPMLKTLGDTIAGVGGDASTFNRLVKVFGDIQAKGHLAAEEVRQFSNIPFAAVRVLSEQLGISTAKVFEMMKARALDAATVIPALLKGMQQQFGGLSDKLVNTVPAQIDLLVKKIKFSLADIGENLKPLFMDTIKTFDGMITKVTELAVTFSQLPPGLQKSLAGMVALAATAPVLGYGLGVLIGGFSRLISILARLGGAGAGIATVGSTLIGLAAAIAAISAASSIAGHLPRIAEGITDIGSSAAKSHSFLLNIISATLRLTNLSAQAGAAMGSFGDKLYEAFHRAVFPLQSTVSSFDALINSLRDMSGEMDQAMHKSMAAGGVGPGKMPSELVPSIGTMGSRTISVPLQKQLETLYGGQVAAKRAAEEEENKQWMKQRDHILGLDDLNKKLQDQSRAYRELAATLTAAQLEQAVATMEKTLSEAFKAGVINVTEYRRRLQELLLDLRERGATQPMAAGKFWDIDSQELAAAQKEAKGLAFSLAQTAADTQLWKAGILNTYEGFKGIAAVMPEIKTGMGVFASVTDDIKDLFKALNNQPGVIQSQDKFGKALSGLGITSSGSLMQTYKEAAKNFKVLKNSGIATTRELNLAWVQTMEDYVHAGGKMTDGMKREYRRLKADTMDAVSVMNRGWRNMVREVSTVLTDFSRSVVNILIPNATASKPPAWLEQQKSVADTLKKAFDDLTAKGFANPEAALKDIIKRIREAGTVAEANRIAIRAFGEAAGPEMARQIRQGTLSADQFNEAVDFATGKITQLSAEVDGKVSKIKAVWVEAMQAMARAAIQELGGALAKLMADHLKPLLVDLGTLILKIPALGDALKGIGGWLGIGGSAASSVGGALPEIISEGGMIGTAAGNIPGVGGGAAGAAGSAASAGITGIIGAVTGAISAATGVIGAFQMHGMNKSLDLIVKHTLETSRQLVLGLQPQIDLYLPWLKNMGDTGGPLWTMHDDLVRIEGLLGGGGHVTTTTNYITVQGATTSQQADALASEFKRRGIIS